MSRRASREQPYGGGETYTNEDRSQVDLYGKWDAHDLPHRLSPERGKPWRRDRPPTRWRRDSFTLPVPARAGYEFAAGTGSNGSTPQKTVTIARGSTGDKVFYANWTPINYSHHLPAERGNHGGTEDRLHR